MTSPPLADRMRPRSLDQVLGQEHLAGPEGLLRGLAAGALPSLILHGPPGSGKTTLARLYTQETGARFVQISAVLSGVADLRRAIKEAEEEEARDGAVTVLFVDEIHRWNKAQQDALLPHVESGTVVLLGATTQNPGFEIIPALRSRCRLVRLQRLEECHLVTLLERALGDEESGLGKRRLAYTPEALERLARAADGDARRALALLEDVGRRLSDGDTLDVEAIEGAVEHGALLHDRSGDAHYDVLSAFIKSIRGSDPDAAVYWLARLIEGGEPPEAIARRVVISAAEDIGNADPRALEVAVAAAQGVAMVGMPEARILLAQAVTWCASAPKSNAAYMALEKARARIRETGSLPVPLHLRNATPISKLEGQQKKYLYPHDFPGHVVEQDYLPAELEGEVFYEPAEHGAEKTVAQRLAWWRSLLERR